MLTVDEVDFVGVVEVIKYGVDVTQLSILGFMDTIFEFTLFI